MKYVIRAGNKIWNPVQESDKKTRKMKCITDHISV
jgi:hypothetical protein